MEGRALLKEKQKKKKLPSLHKLQKEADTLMQKAGKAKYTSSILGGQTEVMHHLIPKSVSAILRYDWENLIPLTNAQHCKLHQSPDESTFVAIIKSKGGIEWYEKLRQRGRETIKVNRQYYEGVIVKLKTMFIEEI